MMDTLFALWFVRLVLLYLAAGLLFAVYFVVRAVNRVDPSAREGSLGFRLLILPGVMVFWPLLLRRILLGQETPPVESNAHRDAALDRSVAGGEVGE